MLTLACWLPGVVAHELTHALVAKPWARTSLNWDDVACEFDWRTGHPAPRLVAYIAPLVVGSALTVGSVAAVTGQPGLTLSIGLAAYATVNLLVYTVASLADLMGVATAAIALATGRRYATDQSTGDHHA